MKILIVDDHAVVRRGLRQILADEFPHVELIEAGTAAAALAHFEATTCDLVLLDINLPDRDGLELLKDLRRARRRLPVLILSIHPEQMYARRMLKEGAAGYLTKDAAPEELARAVRHVLAGHRFVSPALAEQLAADLDAARPGMPHDQLSDREFEVLRLLGAGQPVKQIAAVLALSVKTVSTYRARLLHKMGLRTTADLMRYAIEHRLVE